MMSFPRLLLERLRDAGVMRSLSLRPEDEASAARASALARAGDIARGAAQRQEALALYGRAIDGYLDAGQPWEAESVCRRVLEMEPDVIRTRYTLLAIAVGRGRMGLARERLLDYMDAIRRAGAMEMAVPALLELADATSHQGTRRLLAHALRDLGHPDLGDRVEIRSAACAPEPGWDRARQAALTTPAEVDMEALTAT